MNDKLHPIGGAQDPLNQGYEAERELVKRLSFACDGFGMQTVERAAMNVLLNAVRQQCTTRAGAEARFDEIFGQAKQLLLNHYDGAGRRKSVFKHNQVIEVPLVDLKK